MRILFLSPNWTDDFGIFSSIARKRNSQPPLGILYLASVALKRGHSVRIIDSDVEKFSMPSLTSEILKSNVDLLGITATSPIFHKALNLAKALKRNGFSKPIIIGGEHVNIFKKDVFFDCFDYGFFGESDFSFSDFLKHLENKDSDFDSVKGLLYRKNGQIRQNFPAERIIDLDKLQFPAMHLLNYRKYKMTFVKFKTRNYLPIMATRGCPFKCAYCSEPLTNPVVRFRSAKNVVDEMEKWVKDLGITHFFFMDSNLTLKREQIEGICGEILRRKLKLTFEGWTRANLVDRDILTLLKQSGLIRISYGIESGDPAILRIIRKEVSQNDMLNAFKITDELGIESACSVMLGLPGETKQSVGKTIEFVRNIPQVKYANFSIANPYPGTEMFSWAKEGKYGMRILADDFSEYRRYDFSPIEVNDLSQSDLTKLQKIGLIKMHLKIERIWAAIRILGISLIIPVFFSLVFNLIKERKGNR